MSVSRDISIPSKPLLIIMFIIRKVCVFYCFLSPLELYFVSFAYGTCLFAEMREHDFLSSGITVSAINHVDSPHSLIGLVRGMKSSWLASLHFSFTPCYLSTDDKYKHCNLTWYSNVFILSLSCFRRHYLYYAFTRLSRFHKASTLGTGWVVSFWIFTMGRHAWCCLCLTDDGGIMGRNQI